MERRNQEVDLRTNFSRIDAIFFICGVNQVFLKQFITPISIAMMVVLASSALSLRAETEIEPAVLFAQGQLYYQHSDYAKAKVRFEQLIKFAPNVSRYYHWLGKCYGRIAENSGWLDAISFSKKTLKALEKAVELDDKNIDALEDLMTYYQQAPGFLGGSNKKAQAIAKRLQKLQDTDITGDVTETSSTAY